MNPKTHNELDELPSLKQQVTKVLEKYPNLTAKPICKILKLDYAQYKSYVDNIRHKWKNSLRSQLGSKPHSFHHAHGWVYVDRLGLDRDKACGVGWVRSRNSNRGLIWKDSLGRMVWFETGRVTLFVKAPPTKGRLWQLFCNGFSFTGLIDSWQILETVLQSIRVKGAHAVWETGQKLPYVVIDLFKLSNGIKIKAGDLTHPSAIEVEFCYPDWAEKNERLLARIYDSFNGGKPKVQKHLGPFDPKNPDKYVV